MLSGTAAASALVCNHHLAATAGGPAPAVFPARAWDPSLMIKKNPLSPPPPTWPGVLFLLQTALLVLKPRGLTLNGGIRRLPESCFNTFFS